jgi:hypothetical protein
MGLPTGSCSIAKHCEGHDDLEAVLTDPGGVGRSQ